MLKHLRVSLFTFGLTRRQLDRLTPVLASNTVVDAADDLPLKPDKITPLSLHLSRASGGETAAGHLLLATRLGGIRGEARLYGLLASGFGARLTEKRHTLRNALPGHWSHRGHLGKHRLALSRGSQAEDGTGFLFVECAAHLVEILGSFEDFPGVGFVNIESPSKTMRR